MDIPVFGRFFGTTNDTLDRTELIMLITPHVVRNRDEARRLPKTLKNRFQRCEMNWSEWEENDKIYSKGH